MDHESAPNLHLIKMENGYSIDLGPLIEAAIEVRRNALLDSEFDDGFSASPLTVAAFHMGMRVAVKTLFGQEAANAFDQSLSAQT